MAQNVTLSVTPEGKVNGSIGGFISLLTKADRNDMYKVFSVYAPEGKISNELELKAAIEKAKSELQNKFSGTSVDMNKLMSEFDAAVKTNQIQALQEAIGMIVSFKKTTPGSSEKIAINLALKYSKLLIK